ncbi:tRNA (adenosine(37)-N6)-threonylcarbamoyltransferase complex ATPase subunit type 1 TsaE [Bacillus sp. MUM 13]|uniref:tRNA (adenosine(37)-N6)-threonylcarbamoyltransferase complex ATPase subunit type 1 TsaE n=1 Tax=Bacillus sp. MUM 13 TaxID=1678001 RepID=UPI0008F5A3A7|nr:tRNA (adenosine(37)-N6)-threonylcarbamoyltransferase complex ATPase subunit type 1 TsaE [Bacillus sp. MUM 13]OIK08455.1 tRNA (adenosine(37)-N6)-threonylcarbamoyltransferase complex ATPase subunit type 1 TsaE [Bacillus sp. MUM 13]
MEIFKWISQSAEETDQFAMELAKHLIAGDVLALEGDLGAGKTAFTKGLAKGLGVTRNVNSPTFTIIKEYQGRLPLYHMDVYRVSEGEEDLGFDEYFNGDGVTVVEWAHLIEGQLPAELLQIQILRLDETKRRFVFEAHGERYVKLCKEILS